MRRRGAIRQRSPASGAMQVGCAARWRVLVGAAGLVAVLAGCGTPTSGEAVRVPRNLVPYSLLTATSTGSPTDTALRAHAGPRLFFVDANQHLKAIAWSGAPGSVGLTGAGAAPAPLSTPGSTSSPHSTATPSETTPPGPGLAGLILADLLEGPPKAARADGMRSALAPQTQVSLMRVESGTAFVSWTVSPADPAPGVLPVAIGQIVLTLTSLPGTQLVQFVRDGATADVPLPSGELSARPVGAADYRSLLDE